MKINLAVYTAQEGYSWQPGTALTAEDLGKFKKAIGRFPSADSDDFPFGGVLRVDGRVVFYRYHVAKKIDFCGRDALYCVLGAVSLADAAKIVPAALFALPEFAAPMKPFPVSADVPEADPSAVPPWLKNLDKMTLDVRITGPAESPSYAVDQNPQENQIAQTAAPEDSARLPSAPQCGASDLPAPASDGRARSPSAPRWILWLIFSFALLAFIAASGAIALGLMARARRARETPSAPVAAATNVAPGVASAALVYAATNVLAAATNEVAVVAASSASKSSAQSAANAIATVTNAVPNSSVPRVKPPAKNEADSCR